MAQQRATPFDLAVSLGTAAFYSGITLWFRIPMLLASGHTAEKDRMVSEKAAAATAGMLAAQTEAMRIAAAALTGKQTRDIPSAIAAAALKPAGRTVKANAKRLSRKRRKR